MKNPIAGHLATYWQGITRYSQTFNTGRPARGAPKLSQSPPKLSVPKVPQLNLHNLGIKKGR